MDGKGVKKFNRYYIKRFLPGVMEENMKVNTRKIRNMAMEFFIGLMEGYCINKISI